MRAQRRIGEISTTLEKAKIRGRTGELLPTSETKLKTEIIKTAGLTKSTANRLPTGEKSAVRPKTEILKSVGLTIPTAKNLPKTKNQPSKLKEQRIEEEREVL